MTGAIKRLALLLTVALLLGLPGCKSTPPAARPHDARQNAATPEQVRWTFQPGGVTLNLSADAALNPFEGFTHNMVLCIYQMSDPALFEELSASIGGIEKLLTCAPFDPGMVDAQRHFVRPEETATLVLDRAAGARFLGLVAGYNDLRPGQATALHAFPVTSHHRGWWPWSKAYEPGSLNLKVLLKSNSIESTGVEP